MLNSFVFFFDSPAKTLNRVMSYEYFGYPKDFLFQYQKAIAAVTRPTCCASPRKHFCRRIWRCRGRESEGIRQAAAALGKVNRST